MDETGELDAWNVTRGTIDAFEVPDGFGSATECQSSGRYRCELSDCLRLWVDLVEEATSVLFGKDTYIPVSELDYFSTLEQRTCESPRVILERLHVLDVNNKHIARLSSLNLKRSGEVVDFGQVNVADIVC